MHNRRSSGSTFHTVLHNHTRDHIVHVAFAAWPYFAGILPTSPPFPSAKPQGLPRAQPSMCACVQIIWTKGKFGLSTGMARGTLPGSQNHRLKQNLTGSQLEMTPWVPRLASLHNIVLKAMVMMVSKQGLTKSQITLFYAAWVHLEQIEHTEIHSKVAALSLTHVCLWNTDTFKRGGRKPTSIM